MAARKIATMLVLVTAIVLCGASVMGGAQVWVKCHITCRCLQDDSIGNFLFTIPIDVSPDVSHDADRACKVYGNRVCADGCNGTKFTYTYQVTSP